MPRIKKENINIPKKKVGAPKKNQEEKELQKEIENEIIRLISDNNYSLRKACRQVNINASTFLGWTANDDKLKEIYQLATNERIESLFEEILEIADNTEIGETEKTNANGIEITKADMIAHRRLKIDSRKWYLSKVAPKKYGDKLDIKQEIEGNIDLNITETVQIYLPNNDRDDDNNKD